MSLDLEYEDSNYEPITEDDGGMSCLEITSPDACDGDMSRISQCLLKNGKSTTRVSEVHESDAEIITALDSRFGDSIVSAKINDKTYSFNEGLENLLAEIYRAEVEVIA